MFVRRLQLLCPAYMERASSFSGTHSRPDQLLVLVDRHRERFGRDNSMASTVAADQDVRDVVVRGRGGERVVAGRSGGRSTLLPRDDQGR